MAAQIDYTLMNTTQAARCRACSHYLAARASNECM